MSDVLSYDHVYLAIIAGGQGTRLFPLSNDQCPKQFCFLNNTDTFIQETARRFINIGVKASRIIVITTNPKQGELAKEQLAKLNILSQNICEISPQFGYAGAMVKAAELINRLDKGAIVINTPADQYIVADENFRKTIENAIASAAKGYPTLVGVTVSDINTAMGCGHAEFKLSKRPECQIVKGFVEKPKREEADRLMRADNYACNTGINVWTTKTILGLNINLRASKKGGLSTDVLMKRFDEGTLRIAIGDFKWYDCGTLKSLYEISKQTPNHKNAVLGQGEVFREGCRNSLFVSIEGIEIHAAFVNKAAIVVNNIDGKIVVAIVKLADSQRVRELAEDYNEHKEILINDFSMGARNNYTVNTGFSKEISVGFVGVNDYSVAAIKYRDSGKIVIVVANNKVDVDAHNS